MRLFKGGLLRLACIRLAAIGVILGGMLGAAQPAQAHPADMLFQYHLLTLTETSVDVEWSIYPGYLLVPRTWSEADTSGDSQISPDEAAAWAGERLPTLAIQIDDGAAIPLTMTSVKWPTSLSAFQVGQEVITISASGALPAMSPGEPGTAPGKAHTLSIHNQYEEGNSIYGFDVRSAAFKIEDGQKAGSTYTASLTVQAGEITTAEPQESGGDAAVAGPVAEIRIAPPKEDHPTVAEPSSGTDIAATPAPAPIPSEASNQPSAILAGLVTSGDVSPGFYALALLVSLALGALHALTPGHGKTIVAAYLVGARGTVKHAIALGGITTITHTGSVLLLGVATLVASRYFVPTDVFPVLEVASGVLIAGLGVSLLWQRWRAWRSGEAGHTHSHDHGHDHSHDPSPSNVMASASRPKTRGKLSVKTPAAGDQHGHSHDIPDSITWRSLIGLGVSGGLVPCPDAIAILLVAVAIHRIGLGLALILAFSLGLALVLIGIGVAIVHGSRLLARFDAFGKVAPALPVVSAVIVTGLGIVLTVGAIRAMPSQTAATGGIAIGADTPTATPSPGKTATPIPDQAGEIIYLTLDDQGYSQLAKVAPSGGDPEILTAEPYGVRDYTVDPASRRIVYSAWRADGGSDLYYLPSGASTPTRLLACRQSACSSPVWAPGLGRLIYLMQYIPLPGGALSASAVWSLDVTSGKTAVMPLDDNALGIEPQISPDGRWLAYQTLPGQNLRIVALDTLASIDVENTLGGNKAWQPNSRALVMTGVVQNGEDYHDGLWSIDPASGDHTNIAETPGVDDRQPVWSPDGDRLAFVRYVRLDTGDTEAQVWLANRDGIGASPLIQGQPYAFDRLGWSPDGSTLLAEARLLTGERTIPSLWRIDPASGEITRIVRPGYLAIWVP